MSLPKRKHPRLKQHDYSEPGAYFITVCTKNKAHILFHIHAPGNGGGMGASRPTIHQMVRAIKTGTTRRLGHSIFQTSYYDHVIRGPRDYDEIFQYIQNNPAKWPHDQFYTSDGEEHP